MKDPINLTITRNQFHPFHIVNPSPWPILTSLGAFITFFGFGCFLHYYEFGFPIFLYGLYAITVCLTLWWKDVAYEADQEGHHNSYVRKGIKLGMLLFIVSEIMLFFAFFWAFFHASLNPTIEIGCVWPPKGIYAINPWHLPILNTIVLISSGAYITWSHYALLAKDRGEAIEALCYTVMAGAIFTSLQYSEYSFAEFTISDGVYGSVFYMTTGLHGSHVIVGSIFLMVCLYRLTTNSINSKFHVSFECASWYWHFVDIVWIFVYFFIYWWGYAKPEKQKRYIIIDEVALNTVFEEVLRTTF